MKNVSIVASSTSIRAATKYISQAQLAIVDLHFSGLDCLRILEAARRRNKATVIWCIPPGFDLPTKPMFGVQMFRCDQDMAPLIRSAIDRMRSTDFRAQWAVNFFDTPPSVLSRKERAVLIHCAAGFSRKEIGARLSISRGTVNTYFERIFQKLNLHRISHLTQYAIEHGLL